jgi:hypothetical protein
MTTNTKPARTIAHTIAAYGFSELHRSIAADQRRNPEQKAWAHLGALAAQLVTHVAVEAFGKLAEAAD